MLGFAMDTYDEGAPVVQRGGAGGANQFWTAAVSNGTIRFRNAYTGKVLGVEDPAGGIGTGAVQLSDQPGTDREWVLRHAGGDQFKIAHTVSGRVLGIQGASMDDSVRALLWDDSGTADHLWQFV